MSGRKRSRRTGPKCEFAECPTATYIQYDDPVGRFSFEYPPTWTVQPPTASTNYGMALVSFVDPAEQSTFGGNSDGGGTHLVISKYPDMNSDAARGGSWMGMKTYLSLTEYLIDAQAVKQPISDIGLGDSSATEVTMGGAGANYGIMAERHDGIYELSFVSIWSKDRLTEADRHLINTFRFATLPN